MVEAYDFTVNLTQTLDSIHLSMLRARTEPFKKYKRIKRRKRKQRKMKKWKRRKEAWKT